MEHSRARTLLGLGLVLVGCILLFRTTLAPITPLGALISDDRSAAWTDQFAQHEAQREMQLAQLEAQRAMQEAQREMQLAQLEAQREIREAQQEAQLAQQEAQREMQLAQQEAIGSEGAFAPLPAMPPLPPMPPEPPAFHGGSGPNPALLLIFLGLGLFWWHRRSDRSPRRV